MISSNVRRAAFAATAFMALAAVSSAQKTFSFPHVLERDGRIVAIAWDLSGGQRGFVVETDASGSPVARQVYRPLVGTYSLYGNDEVFKIVQASLNNENWDFGYSLYPLRRVGLGVGRNDMFGLEVGSVTFPACDVNSKEPAGVEISFNPKEFRFARLGTAEEIKAGNEVAKKQKLWSPANFRVSIEGLPTGRVIRCRQVQATITTQPSHGRVTLVSDSEITIPLSDAPAYREKLLATMKGEPGDLNFQLDYLDEDGNVLLSLRSVVQIMSVDKDDPFDPFDPADAANAEKPVKVALKHTKGHVTLFR